MMNVFDIPKQSDHRLVYSKHALDRARERDVPLPEYIPFNAKLVDAYKINDKYFVCKLTYRFNDTQYAMIVDEFGKVITLYPFGPTSMFQRIQSNYAKRLAKEKEEDNFIVSDDYICLGYETDYYLYQ